MVACGSLRVARGFRDSLQAILLANYVKEVCALARAQSPRAELLCDWPLLWWLPRVGSPQQITSKEAARQ